MSEYDKPSRRSVLRSPQEDVSSTAGDTSFYEEDTSPFSTPLQLPKKSAKQSVRQRLLRLVLAMGAMFLATVVIAGIAYAAAGKSAVETWYLDQEPYTQEVWCRRVEKYLKSSHFCELRNEAAIPDNPYLPTLQPDPNGPSADDLLTAPLFDATPTTSPTEDINSTSSVVVTPSPEVVEIAEVVEAQSSPTPSPLPTSPPTVTLIPPTVFVPTSSPTPPPVSARLDLGRLTPEYQGWNNCGPTTLTMGLSYFGYNQNQTPAASFLKPNREDKNVSPWQMVRYINELAINTTNVHGLTRIGGSMDLVKRLLAAGYPVIIEKGYEPEGYDWMGHYLLLVGYDDNLETFYAYDSFLGSNNGQGRPESYATTEYYWSHFNYTFIVLYEPTQEAQLREVLGSHADVLSSVEVSLERARNAASVNPNDKWAWFNMGDAYARLGRYQEAAAAFDQAFQLQMPWRTLWYLFTPFETYYQLGRYEDVLRLADNLDSTSQNYVEEAWYYRGLAYAALGRSDDAITQFERVLRFNENFTLAAEAITAIRANTFAPPVPAS
jgi:tetratricopeptide (TPR) repeat protein